MSRSPRRRLLTLAPFAAMSAAGAVALFALFGAGTGTAVNDRGLGRRPRRPALRRPLCQLPRRRRPGCRGPRPVARPGGSGGGRLRPAHRTDADRRPRHGSAPRPGPLQRGPDPRPRRLRRGVRQRSRHPRRRHRPRRSRRRRRDLPPQLRRVPCGVRLGGRDRRRPGGAVADERHADPGRSGDPRRPRRDAGVQLARRPGHRRRRPRTSTTSSAGTPPASTPSVVPARSPKGWPPGCSACCRSSPSPAGSAGRTRAATARRRGRRRIRPRYAAERPGARRRA